jgi:signal transduction histidine kinase
MLIQYSEVWDAAALKRFYAELLRSANSEVELLNDLLSWARVQTGRMPFMPETFDAASVLQGEISLIRNMADSKGVAFDVGIPDGTLVNADSRMFSVIVRNLLTNAVKFTGKDGNVALAVEKTSADKCTVTVSDTGMGMTTDQLRNLFRIDNPSSTSGTSGEQGTGLGLTVCKELVEKHGSTLHVDSEPGKGSRFWFTLPPAEPQGKIIP